MTTITDDCIKEIFSKSEMWSQQMANDKNYDNIERRLM